MNLYRETKRDQVVSLLEFIALSKKIIAILQDKADKHPELMDICSEGILQQKEMLNHYKEWLKEAYALSNEEN